MRSLELYFLNHFSTDFFPGNFLKDVKLILGKVLKVPRRYLPSFFIYRKIWKEAESVPSKFFRIARKRRQISARKFQYLIQHEFDVLQRNFKKCVARFLKKRHFSAMMFRHIWVKKDKCSRASRTYSFEVKYKNDKNVKLSYI